MDAMKCSNCKKDTVYFVWDKRHKQIRFYPNPSLNEAEIKHATTQMEKVPDEEDAAKYAVLLHCSMCGTIIRYSGIPLDWECFDTPGPLDSIPLKALEPWMTVAKLEDEKKE